MIFVSKPIEHVKEKKEISYKYMEYMLLQYEQWKGILEFVSYLTSSGRVSYGGRAEGAYSNDPERIVIMLDRLSRQLRGIDAALGQLDQDEYKLIKLCYFLEQRDMDVARALGIHDMNVFRARKQGIINQLRKVVTW